MFGQQSAKLMAMIVLAMSLGTAAAKAGDWPTYRHDVGRTGWTTDHLSLPLAARWTYVSPGQPRTAWAGQEGVNREGIVMVQRVKFDDALHLAVVNDRLYFGSSVDHKLYCLRVADGTELWSFCAGGPIRLAPAVWENRVLFGADDGWAYCLDADTGRLVWKVHPSPKDEWLLSRGDMISRWPVRTGVLVDGGVAYFGAGIFPHENVYLYAVDFRTGKVVWKQDGISESSFHRSDLSPQGHLLLEGDRLFVPSGGTLPAFVNRVTGEILQKPTHAWRSAAGGAVGGSEALLADGQLYSFGAHHILAMDQKSGKVGFGWFVGQQMVVDRDSAYVTTGKEILRLDRDRYAAVSRQRHDLEIKLYNIKQAAIKDPLNAKKLATQTKAAVAALKTQLAGVSPDDGIVWKTPCPDSVSLVGASDLIFVGGKGNVTALDAATGKQRWQCEVEGNARSLAVGADCLWVSTSTGRIYCFGVMAGNGPASPAIAKASPYPADQHTAMYEAAAEEILRRTNVRRGFCLVVGSERGRLAYELARRSELKIYGVEPDPAKVDEARQALSAAGLYGTRVVIHCVPLDAIPYSNYFANLVVSDRLLQGSPLPDAPKIARHVKPLGGVICLGSPTSTGSMESLVTWLGATQLGDTSAVRTEGTWAMLTRGALPGAGSWTHQYGEAGNTACSDDQHVCGDLGVLWYGEPGPAEMANRHGGTVAPLAMDGRFFVQGERNVMAYDAYNGLFLWESPDPDAWRNSTGRGRNPGNLAAGDGRIFVVAAGACRELDAVTGHLIATHLLPSDIDPKTYAWEYVSYRNGVLVGTAARRPEVIDKAKRRGRPAPVSRDVVFAIDTRERRTLWIQAGHSITPTTVAFDGERVFFIDNSLTAQERDAFLRQDKSELKGLTGKAAEEAEARLKTVDVRRLFAVDARTGKTRWMHPVDVTDCTNVGPAAGSLTVMYRDGVLVVCGANGNGHYWAQFIAGEFKRRRLVALDAADGRVLWAKDANYRHRPVIVEQRVIAEPWAYDLRTGDQQMREHPITGESVPWDMLRPGHHCGAIAACPHLLAFRSWSLGSYDLDADVGTQHYAGQRPGCWINAIPANGVVMVPEASSGCVCLFSIESTIVMEPRSPRRPWAVASFTGATTPVRHLALNLGAPGDRRDGHGTLWLAYPRQANKKATGLEILLDLKPKFVASGGFRNVDSEDTAVAGTDTPWLFTSWAQGVTSLSVPLLESSSTPAQYDVKLYFADLSAVKPGVRRFDVKLQGRTVLANVDPAAKKGAFVSETHDVAVTDQLRIELVPAEAKPSADQMPILSAVEITRSDRR
jgi:outer membrane protein assembly factor BamB